MVIFGTANDFVHSLNDLSTHIEGYSSMVMGYDFIAGENIVFNHRRGKLSREWACIAFIL